MAGPPLRREADGLLRQSKLPASGPFLLTVLGAVLLAILLFLASLGGVKWMGVFFLAVTFGAGLLAWVYLRRQFLALCTVLFTFTIPIIVDVEVYEPYYPPVAVSGFPHGLTIYIKAVFLMVLGVVWFLEIVGGRARTASRLGWASRWLEILLAWSLLFPVHTVDLHRSAISWTLLLRHALGFWYLARRVDSRDLLRWIVYGVAAQVWLQGLVAFAQYATGSKLGLDFIGERGVKEFDIPTGAILRSGALLGHPNDLALYMVTVGPLLQALAMRRQSPLAALGWWSTWLMASTALVLTFSRAGWVCAAVGFLLVWHLRTRQSGHPLVLSLAMPLFLMVAGGIAIFTLVEPVRERLLMPDSGSTETRWQQFRTALNIFRHWPVVGTGLSSYIDGAWRFNAGRGGFMNVFYRVHNGSLLMLTETGFLGALAYHGWWWCVLRRAWGTWRFRDPFLAAVGAGAAVGLCNWFLKSQYNIHTPVNDGNLWLMAALPFILWNVARREDAAAAA